ncbi:nitrilase-related carbon-nitrogen hydrolase [Evansella halocellulosilytica]|uniref:nitrilase-related carbon-nitrogen hydrolase n=1 Tax=Evansella halocellulosilytica TaxID=2011013 RepID=UPI00211C58B9|nr:nitrilase-related carbon-nitrogen hydrolase [Evansella halocellulosilytica]
MSGIVSVAAVQMHSAIGEVITNRQQAVEFVREAAANGAKLISLPELWVTGYGLETGEFHRLSEPADGETVSLFKQLANELKVVLIIPFPEKATKLGIENMFISAAIIDADGTVVGIYRKSMLWGEESRTFVRGEKRYHVYETAIGRIGVLICYDIEFPEPTRLLALQGADLLVVPSVWSKEAKSRWDIQLPARGLDNTIYVLGTNAVSGGACGKSKFIGPQGTVLNEASSIEEEIIYGEVDLQTLLETRKTIPYLKDYKCQALVE